jgi:hypothetical protein
MSVNVSNCSAVVGIYKYMENFKFPFVSISFRFQRSRGVRRVSVAARMLELRIRIPPGARMSVVSVVYCQVEVPGTG